MRWLVALVALIFIWPTKAAAFDPLTPERAEKLQGRELRKFPGSVTLYSFNLERCGEYFLFAQAGPDHETGILIKDSYNPTSATAVSVPLRYYHFYVKNQKRDPRVSFTFRDRVLESINITMWQDDYNRCPCLPPPTK